jgi:hypothetical protein
LKATTDRRHDDPETLGRSGPRLVLMLYWKRFEGASRSESDTNRYVIMTELLDSYDGSQHHPTRDIVTLTGLHEYQESFWG